jgi:hypothetical protein
VTGQAAPSTLLSSLSTSLKSLALAANNVLAQGVSVVGSVVSSSLNVVAQIGSGLVTVGKDLTVGLADFIDASGTLGNMIAKPFDFASQVTNLVSQVSQYVSLGTSVLYNLCQNILQLFLELDYFGLEPGNYNLITTMLNLFNPQPVDRPLTANDQTLPYAVPATYGQVDRKAYFKWQKVQMPQSTGAKCGNGSDYKFFVNLTPASNNFLIFMEPGGGCYDYGSCTGKLPKKNPDGSYMFDKNGVIQEGSQRGVFNPDGIGDNYVDTWPQTFISGNIVPGSSLGGGGIETPLMSRFSATSATRFKMQGWNLIFMPYCTGDTHVGDMTRLFTRVDGKASKLMYFKGMNNVIATMGWLRSNLPQPAQIFLTGMSAGSLGVDANRVMVRRILNPWDSLYTMADSGFVLSEDPVNHDLNPYPATDSISRIRKVWWDYDPANPGKKTPIGLAKAIVPAINPENLSTFGIAVNHQFPQDRMSYVNSQSDQDFSGYAYLENKGFREAALADGDINNVKPISFSSNLAKFVRKNWLTDLGHLQDSVSQMTMNTGYYMPSGRIMNESHCMLGLTYEGVYNADTGHTIVDAINNLVDRSRPPVLRERESDPMRGLFLPLGPTSQFLRKFVPDMFSLPVN